MSLDCIYFFLSDKYNNLNIAKKYHSILVEKNNCTINQCLIINKLTKYNNYFYIPENIHDVNSYDVNSIEVYDNLQDITSSNKTNYYLFKYKKKQLIYLKYFLKKLHNPKKYLYFFINIYKSLLHSINILVENSIIHNHIELDNILIDELGNPLLNNFNYSLNTIDNNLLEIIKYCSTEYTINNSPELVIISYMLTNKLNNLSLFNITTIIDSIIEKNILLHNFGKDFIDNYKKNGLNYFEKYINKSYEYIIEDIKKYSHTWDNYSLSMVFLKICIDIHKYINNSNRFILLFMKLLVQNISIDPTNRLSIEDTTNKFQEILHKINYIEYITLLSSLNGDEQCENDECENDECGNDENGNGA
jgi:hypothetical protein